MITGVVELLQDAVTSPWAYVVILTVALLDAFLPVVPSETVVITAGVFAASGEPNLLAVIAAAALGAFVGDHVAYGLGRRSQGRVARVAAGSRRAAALAWAREAFGRYGGMVLVVARYVPGGRTATTLTMGAVGYPVRRFLAYDALAATSWAVYAAMAGYLGGAAFEDRPLYGLLLGLGLALLLSLAVELLRRLVQRRVPQSTPESPALVACVPQS